MVALTKTHEASIADWAMRWPRSFCAGAAAAPYDAIAPVYDDLFADDGVALAENHLVAELLAYNGGTVLDIGCGTGLLLDLIDVAPEDYIGIDPSGRMLERFAARRPTHQTLQVQYENLVFRPGFPGIDLAVGLFGSPNYVDPGALHLGCFNHLTRRDKSRGRFFLMFYADWYRPVTYERSGVSVDHFDNAAIDLLIEDFGASVERFGNYLIVQGQRP